MLWNFFRSIPGVTAFYEPLHPDLLQSIRFGAPVQERHYGVKAYFDEYRGLDRISQYYRPSLGLSRLYLRADEEHDELRDYIWFLLKSSESAKVCKFNRIDFRLPWIRRNFPEARIIHLHRNVRDQWKSSLRQYAGDVKSDPDANPSALKIWSDALSGVFPFLSIRRIHHAYQRYYYLWKLSYLFGRAYSDFSFSYEEWITSPRESMKRMLHKLDLNADLEALYAANPVVVRESKLSSVDGMSDKRFAELEAESDRVLAEYGLLDGFESRGLEEIRKSNNRYRAEGPNPNEGYLRQIEHAFLELSRRLTQVYEKEIVIKELMQEIDVQRKAAAERLALINQLTREVGVLREEISKLQGRK